ncbi:hypothetical protein ACTMTJ_12130 [Phytohabitans sp. LJ34]|uniref:hypothetical protein n=1 Tax=Phytohabitans sp. LJ34 TaxID=3452217 RepID=UPI003F8A2124
MRARVVRVLVAALVAVAVVVPGTVRPAQADTADEINKYLDIANKAVTLVKSILGGGASDAAIKSAVQQIIAAVEGAKTQIIAHVDALAAAEVQGCVRHHVIEFADIDRFDNQTVLQLWAQDATGCATLASSVLRAVSDKAAADNLAAVVNIIGPIAMAARARAGFQTFGLTSELRSANQVAIQTLAPRCVEGWAWFENDIPFWEIYCAAYNGDVADMYFPGPPGDRPAAEARATQRTFRALAMNAVPLYSI